jgi:pyruvate dehydrogenase E1 component alpha subunit
MMCRIRGFEEQCVILTRQGLIGGAIHLYIGEEAVAAGSIAVLNEDDYIASTHRGHGHCIAKGADVGKMFAELLGKETGYCRGKGGSMHIADVTRGVLGANGIVGAGVPIATGAALAVKYKGEKKVVLSFFGDGATNTGAFHEAVNMAAIWNLPVVFVCENNMYAITMPIKKACALQTIADRAGGYGIPGLCVDGNDVIAVWEATVEAVERARRGEGPTLLECQTYRWLGHHLGDDGKYRPPEEVDYWKEQRDPIKVFGQKLLEEKILTKKALAKVHKEVDTEIKSALEFAEDSEPARLEGVLEDVYYEQVAQ